MKLKIYLIFILAVTALVSSCHSDDDLNYQSEFDTSRQTLSEFMQISGDSYQYVVSGGSVFTSYGWETTISVINGAVVERSFRFVGNQEELPEEAVNWTENGDEIGSHANSGADPLTLDEIYLKAETEWLIKRDDAQVYFEANNDGMISLCGYVENACMDDCFRGIHIKSIEALYFSD